VLLLPENDFVAVFPQVLVTEDDEAIKVHNMDVCKACDVPKLSYRRRWQTVDVDDFFLAKDVDGCPEALREAPFKHQVIGYLGGLGGRESMWGLGRWISGVGWI
jgi:hypothetical protein